MMKLLMQLMSGGTNTDSGNPVKEEKPVGSGRSTPQTTENGQVVISPNEYFKLLNASAKGKKKRGFPAKASKSGNNFYLLKDEMVDSGRAEITYGWEAAETRFGKGRSWDHGKLESGRLVEGYSTFMEAYSRYVSFYPGRMTVSVIR